MLFATRLVAGNFPMDELVHEVEQCNRLKLILPWIEARVQAGSEDPAVFNAIAKIYIDSDSDSNPEQFLKENNLYEPLVVGKFCEPRDPYLAYIAYAKRSHELVVITNDSSMFKQQARYFVEHCEPDLWTPVLAHDIVHCRRPLIDQILVLFMLRHVISSGSRSVGFYYASQEGQGQAKGFKFWWSQLSVYPLELNEIQDGFGAQEFSLPFIQTAIPDLVWAIASHGMYESFSISKVKVSKV
ncbi:hypothetical protein GALMADRAFT_141590 [Galerina marginata CBS 339.88]|uniref:Uncharacterized protein n=1 Tax=Galerina marginata (strain CBS 339.88) TaxID=685588 RepID=A0A067SWZ8_GALM3|nr:hypothetical protein GALMADRAFT_141590 [Galerina marginata CBS 339.88]